MGNPDQPLTMTLHRQNRHVTTVWETVPEGAVHYKVPHRELHKPVCRWQSTGVGAPMGALLQICA